MNSAYEVILFDFGGTLDTNGVHWSVKYYEVLKPMFPSLGFDTYSDVFVKADEILQQEAKHIDNYYELLAKQFSLQCNLLTQKLELHINHSQYKIMFEKIYSDVQDNIRNSIEIIRSLKQNYRIGIVSNFYGNLQTICDNLGLSTVMDIVVDSSIVGYSKPDPEIFLFALKKLSAFPDKCVVVGDSYERDIKPSKQIGCTTIWLKGKSWKNEYDSTYADFTITTLFEIRKILNSKTKI